MNDLSDQTIIEHVLGGDTRAFGVLVGRYSQRVFALACRICGNREDAEELTQDTFVKAFNALRKFRGGSSFSTWLYRIAYNTVISYVRKHKKGVFTELCDERFVGGREEVLLEEDFDPGILSREEQLDRLERSLELMPPQDRVLLTLFYQADKSVREIAEIVSQSEGNVKIRLFRSRKRLAAIYNESK